MGWGVDFTVVDSVGGIKTSSSREESTTGEVNTKLMWDDRTGIAKVGSANTGAKVTEVGDILQEKADSGGDSGKEVTSTVKKWGDEDLHKCERDDIRQKQLPGIMS